MTPQETAQLLKKFKLGEISEGEVLNAFRAEPIDDLGFAKIDTHRAMRQGFPEVIFGSGKTPEQVATIAVRILKHEQRVLITRVDDDQAIAVAAKLPAAVYHESARCITIETKQPVSYTHLRAHET